ncbi:hypothetical protein [Lactobacillus phage JNU_P5]|nr:hypothetical protein [Lactobacillus phage JNU_P5]
MTSQLNGWLFILEREVSGITQRLTQKQRRFVDEHVIFGNATQSYKAAGSTPARQVGRDVVKLRVLHRILKVFATGLSGGFLYT